MEEQIKDLFHKNVWPFIQEQNLENKKLSIEIIIGDNKKNSQNEGTMPYEISLNCENIKMQTEENNSKEVKTIR